MAWEFSCIRGLAAIINKFLLVDSQQNVCYNKVNKISPRNLQEIVSVMHWRQTGALLERHSSYGVPFALYRAYPMIQNGPPAPARLLASFRMMERSQLFSLRL